MEIKDFINGKGPECKKNPKGTHVKVKGMHIKKPYCLHCGIKLN